MASNPNESSPENLNDEQLRSQISLLETKIESSIDTKEQTSLITQREKYREKLFLREMTKIASQTKLDIRHKGPSAATDTLPSYQPIAEIPSALQLSTGQQGTQPSFFRSLFSASSDVSSSVRPIKDPFNREALQRLQRIMVFRKQFCEYVTKNVHIFVEGTHFVASMEKEADPNDDQLFLYPGMGAQFREGAIVPEQFRDPNNPLEMHPDLDLQVRKKSHRVLEGILNKKITLWQTILPHPFVDNYPSRGGGAKLKAGVLHSTYKSGVLNGKWDLRMRNKLEYGELPELDRSRFNQAMATATNHMVTTPDESRIIPLYRPDISVEPFARSLTLFSSITIERSGPSTSSAIYTTNENVSEDHVPLVPNAFEKHRQLILDYLESQVNSDLSIPGKTSQLTYLDYLKHQLKQARNQYEMEVCILGVFFQVWKPLGAHANRLRAGLTFIMVSEHHLNLVSRYGIKFSTRTTINEIEFLLDRLIKYRETEFAAPLLYQQGIKLLVQLYRASLGMYVTEREQIIKLQDAISTLMRSVTFPSGSSDEEEGLSEEFSSHEMTETYSLAHETLKSILLTAHKAALDADQNRRSSWNPSAASLPSSQLAPLISHFMKNEFDMTLPAGVEEDDFEPMLLNTSTKKPSIRKT